MGEESDDKGKAPLDTKGKGDGSSDGSAGLEDQGGGKNGGAENLTLDQVTTLVKENVAEAISQGQSYADKAVAASNKALGQRFGAIDNELKALKDAGIEVPPEARQVLRTQAIEEHYEGEEGGGEESDDGSGAKGSTKVTPQQQAAQAAAQEAMRRVREAGVQITETSPAFKTIDRTTEDPNLFLASVDKAIAEHKTWLAEGGKGSSSDKSEEGAEGEGDEDDTPGKGMQGTGAGKGKGSGDVPADATPRRKFEQHFQGEKT